MALFDPHPDGVEKPHPGRARFWARGRSMPGPGGQGCSRASLRATRVSRSSWWSTRSWVRAQPRTWRNARRVTVLSLMGWRQRS
jgi:hypothetical protein